MGMEMLRKTLETKKDVKEGQLLDMPLINFDKDKENCIMASYSIAHSRWIIDLCTPQEQSSLQSITCDDDVGTNVKAQSQDHQRASKSSLEPHGSMVQEKRMEFSPKVHKSDLSTKDSSKSTRPIVDFTKCRSIDEFENLQMIGEGTHGVVFRACDKKTGQVVALKKFIAQKWQEDMTPIMEFQILSSIHHPSIIEVKEIVVNNNMSPSTKFMVMEYIEHDLKGLMVDSMVRPFSQSEVKCLMLQLFDGVKFLHDNGVIHRDLKPSNVLLNNCGELKICDFGMSQRFGSQPLKHIYEIVTLWYRAPELLLEVKEYSIAIDMWSLGCIMAELLLKEPLFWGHSRLDQINKICNILGNPNKKIWPHFETLVQVPTHMVHQPFSRLREKFPSLSSVAKPTLTSKGFDLLNRLLIYDPLKRITINEALNHEWFQEIPLPKAKEFMPTFPIKI